MRHFDRCAVMTALEARVLLSASASDANLGMGARVADEMVVPLRAAARVGESSALSVAISKNTLPASVVADGATHGVESVQITNSGASTESGVATVNIFASPDGAVDGSSILVGTLSHSLSLKSDKSTTVKVTIKSLAALPQGDYTLLAKITDPQGDVAVSAGGPAVSVAAPFFAFSETVIKSTLALADISGQASKAVLELKITNHGNAASSGNSTLAVYASPDTNAADGTLIRSVVQRVVIKPGASKTVTVLLQKLPAVTDGSYHLIGVVTDPQANVTSAASAGTYTLAAPFISLVPSAGAMVKAKVGTATVSFILTNKGNVASSGIGTIAVLASSDGTAESATAVFTQHMSLVIKPGNDRLVRLKLTVPQVKLLQAAAASILQVTDPLGSVQTLTLQSVAQGVGTLAPVAGMELASVSVGADGSVWGLDTTNEIFAFDPGSSQFTQVPGSLTSITVGMGTAVWGLSGAAVYHWDAAGGAFDAVPGSLQQIAVGADGDTWGIGLSGGVFHYNAGANTFSQLTGTFSQVAVGNSGSVYALTSVGALYWFDPGTAAFELVNSASGVSSITVGSDGTIWGENNDVAYYYNVLNNTFTPTTGAIAKVINGAGPSVYGLNANGDVLHFDGTTLKWVQIPGQLSDLAAGGNGSVWGVDSTRQVFELTGQPTRAFQTLRKVSGSVNQLSVGADGTVWGVSNGTVEIFNYMTQSFHAVAGAPSMQQVSVGARADVWGTDANGTIYRYNATSATFTSVPGGLSLVQVSANGSVWGLDGSGAIYTYNSSSQAFTNVPGQLGAVSVGADGDVWGIDGQLQVYHYRPDLSMFVNAPGSLEQITVGNASNIWGIDAQSKVYFFDEDTQQWINVPNASLVEIWATFDGAVWGADSSGNLLQWNASTQTFVQMGTAVTQVLAGNDASVWATDAATGEVFTWV